MPLFSDNNSTLIQLMAWYPAIIRPLSEPILDQYTITHCINSLQWVYVDNRATDERDSVMKLYAIFPVNNVIWQRQTISDES